MSEILLALSGICIIVTLIDVALILVWPFSGKTYHQQFDPLPFVSILVAARNEEDNITRCITALLQLDYPKDKFEILVGNDASEDATLQILQAYGAQYDQIKIFSIITNLGHARGKANVLAHLAKNAKGELYLITDADVAVPVSWIKGMLKGCVPQVGIVNGMTCIEDEPFQNIDWILALGMVKTITQLSRPVTAMGNNMLITRKAYISVGGYESIPFSITEDFELFRHVLRKGYLTVQMFEPAVLAKSKGISGFSNLLNQRKRWMRGAVQLPWPIVSLLIVQALYYPALLILFLVNPFVGAIISSVKWILQSSFIVLLYIRLKKKIDWAALLLYELYSLVFSLVSSVFFLLPGKIRWKGRKY